MSPDSPSTPAARELNSLAAAASRDETAHPRRGHVAQLALAVALYGSGALLTYATKSVLARSLGPSGYGTLALALGVASLAAGLGSIGLPVALTRFLAFNSDRAARPRLVAVGLSAIAVGALVAGVAAALISRATLPAVSGVIAGWTGVATIVGIALFAAVGDGAAGAGRGLGWIGRPLALRDIAQRGVVLAGAGLVAALGLGPRAALLAYLIGGGVYAIGGVIALGIHFLSVGPAPDAWGWQSDLRKLILFSAPLIGSFVSIQIVNQADNVFVAIFRGAYAVGLYNAAFPIAQIVWLGADTVVFVAGPSLAQAAGMTDLNRLARRYSALLVTAVGVAVAISAPLIALPQTALFIVFGPSYVPAAQALMILAIGACAYSAGGVSGSALVAQGRTTLYFLSDASGMALNLALHALLVPRFGITGAAVAVAAALTVVAAIRTAAVGPARGSTQSFVTQAAAPAAAIVIVVAVICALARLLPIDPNFQLVGMYAAIAVVMAPFLMRIVRRADV